MQKLPEQQNEPRRERQPQKIWVGKLTEGISLKLVLVGILCIAIVTAVIWKWGQIIPYIPTTIVGWFLVGAILLATFAGVSSFLDEKKGGAKAKKALWPLAAAALGVLALVWYSGLPLYTGAAEHASTQKYLAQDCTAEHSCSPVLAGATTVPVKIPDGKSTCFSHDFWGKVPRLHYQVSYGGGEWATNSCTLQQVLQGSCQWAVGDHFRFAPEQGISLPNYWFVPAGTPNCS